MSESITATGENTGAARESAADATGARRFNWRAFWLLTGAGIFGTLMLLPAALALQAEVLKDVPVPLWVIIPLQTIQNALLIGGAVALGLWLGPKTGLGAPLVEARARGESVGARLRRILVPSVALGVAASLVIVLLEEAVFVSRMPAPAQALEQEMAAWQEFLARVFYGGITEEILMRFGLFTLAAWLLGKLSRDDRGRPSLKALWGANLLIAVLFGLAHLPATAMLFPITPLVVARALLLNGVAGLAFGYLYWTRGLESSMLAHASGGIILLAAARLFGT